jgi:hypothetical protein
MGANGGLREEWALEGSLELMFAGALGKWDEWMLCLHMSWAGRESKVEAGGIDWW